MYHCANKTDHIEITPTLFTCRTNYDSFFIYLFFYHIYISAADDIHVYLLLGYTFSSLSTSVHLISLYVNPYFHINAHINSSFGWKMYLFKPYSVYVPLVFTTYGILFMLECMLLNRFGPLKDVFLWY